MEHLLLIIHICIAAVMVGIILLQKSDSDGTGLGGGAGGSSFMTGRAQANLLTRTTGILAGCFFLTSLSLAYIAHQKSGGSLVDNISAESPATSGETPTTPENKKESAPVVPLAE